MLSNAKVVLTWGRMISYLAISLVDAIFWRHSDGVCLLTLWIGDSVAATIKHLDEFNGIYQGQHCEEESAWAKDFIKLYTLVWQYSSRHPLFPVINVCKNEPNSLGTFIALSARSDGRVLWMSVAARCIFASIVLFFQKKGLYTFVGLMRCRYMWGINELWAG